MKRVLADVAGDWWNSWLGRKLCAKRGHDMDRKQFGEVRAEVCQRCFYWRKFR